MVPGSGSGCPTSFTNGRMPFGRSLGDPIAIGNLYAGLS
jgi:hypothetical protein